MPGGWWRVRCPRRRGRGGGGAAGATARRSGGTFVKDTANNPQFGEGLYDTPSPPWEPRFDNGYPNVFWDPEHRRYRCYYPLFVVDPSSSSTPVDQRAGKPYSTAGRVTGCSYAESADGVHRTNPALGIVDFDGEDLRLLADIEHGGSISVALTDRNGTVVQPGFEAGRSVLTEGPDGWHQVSWRGADVGSLDPGAFFALRITMVKTRLWALGGDFYVRPLKYAKP
ncbi:hypothetical protein [Streptomyces sp. NBC_00448]|uniref:hypothetical protein n=1 Tax=Streptomyces sp. NBC_00448 TaxID=2903652 RepID=UPI002E1C5604